MSSRYDSPADAARCKGRVQRVMVERGFGFIRALEGAHAGKDFFFHASGLDNIAIANLEEGATVLFEMREVAKGLRAEHVTLSLER